MEVVEHPRSEGSGKQLERVFSRRASVRSSNINLLDKPLGYVNAESNSSLNEANKSEMREKHRNSIFSGSLGEVFQKKNLFYKKLFSENKNDLEKAVKLTENDIENYRNEMSNIKNKKTKTRRGFFSRSRTVKNSPENTTKMENIVNGIKKAQAYNEILQGAITTINTKIDNLRKDPNNQHLSDKELETLARDDANGYITVNPNGGSRRHSRRRVHRQRARHTQHRRRHNRVSKLRRNH